jgi:hypothetical protein
MSVIESIKSFVQKTAVSSEYVRHGVPVNFTEASTSGDRIWQGDLALTIRNKVPKGYVSAEFSKLSKNLQLVHGSNVGSMHCLDSTEGVELFIPADWNEESLKGPFFKLAQERTVTHPKHGNVTIPAGFSVQCSYQREYDAEQKRERRARD